MTDRGGSIIFGPSHRAAAGAGGRSVVGMDAVRRELRGSAIALVMVAVTTLVVYALTQSLEVRRGSVIYLLPVLLAGWHLGLIPALVAAGAGGLWSGYFFFFPEFSLLLPAAERTPQSGVVHGGRRGNEPPCKFHEDADRNRPQTRKGDGRSLRLFAPAGGGVIRRGHLPRDPGASGQPGSAQGGVVRNRRRR